jgi:hypothetical protein
VRGLDLTFLDGCDNEDLKTVDLMMQDAPSNKTVRQSVYQPVVFGFNRAGVRPGHLNTEDGARGIKYALIANACVFGRPRGTKPYTDQELQERAALAAHDLQTSWEELCREAKAASGHTAESKEEGRSASWARTPPDGSHPRLARR